MPDAWKMIFIVIIFGMVIAFETILIKKLIHMNSILSVKNKLLSEALSERVINDGKNIDIRTI